MPPSSGKIANVATITPRVRSTNVLTGSAQIPRGTGGAPRPSPYEQAIQGVEGALLVERSASPESSPLAASMVSIKTWADDASQRPNRSRISFSSCRR